MGLKFLNKKTWHTGSFKNIEIVWKAQQEEKRRLKIQEENIKKLKEEKHIEELKRLQVEAGLIPESDLQKMEWMYSWGTKVQDTQEKDREKYLLGEAIDQKSKRDPLPIIIQEEHGNIRNEEFIKLHEDPLFAIRQQELKIKQDIMRNPIQMKGILQEMEKYKRGNAEISDKKKSKKEKKEKKSKKEKKEKKDKKEKKQKKEKKRHLSSSSDAEQEEETRKQVKTSLFDDYLKKRLGPIMVESEGKLKPDYGFFKRQHREQEKIRNLSSSQKEEMVEKMKQDAEQIKQSIHKQHERDFKSADNVDNQKSNPQFLSKMTSDIYNKDVSIDNLASRVARNKSYLQRDLEKDSYRR